MFLGDISIVVCPSTVTAATDAKCSSIKSTSMTSGEVTTLFPTDTSMIHGNKYKIGIKSSLIATLSSLSSTIITMSGKVSVSKPTSAQVVRSGGSRRTTVTWNGNNVASTAGLKITLCYKNTLPEIYRGICHELFNVGR